ncbi:cyclin-dependent kinase inhibitor 1B-like [Pyxicephalus adspersus]|uniref:cyclin-dependent kinase inhibitor 1B-like n=1 Tax=Pyxicephalus adspersus TaxID=30357 RepID=UPI003B5B308B
MSGVRLSPGSPGVERVSRAPGSPRPLARRCLFGPVDGQSLAREAARYRAEMEEESRARWNFDFNNDRPLDGALQWEEAGPDTPEFYRRPVHRKPAKKRSGPETGPPSNSSQTTHKAENGETSDGSSTPLPEQTPKKSRPST